MLKLDKGTVINDTILLKIIENHRATELPRLKKLKKYYLAQNEDILSRPMKDKSQPNNKIANAYASYITDTLTGYFVGKPITYNHPDGDILEEINNNFKFNDEADENMELAKNASIYGVAYEQIFINEEGQLRFEVLPTEECIPIYDTTLNNELLYFVRYYLDYDIVKDKRYYAVDFIDTEKIARYRSDENLSHLNLLEVLPHYFGEIPIAIYKNNDEEMGDFERVITLIDAYDKMQSDSLNDFEYFTNAYLALYGYNADEEDIARMKEQRVLMMDDGTKAEFLTKPSGENNVVEVVKSRLDNDIHKFAKCPNMSDEEFASNASGIAIKFKTLGTENLVSVKERKFKRGLQQRLALIGVIDNILGINFNYTDVDIIFTRNLPTNELDIANVVNALKDLVSDETLLAQIPFVEDVQAELERLKLQKEENKINNPFFTSGDDYLTAAMDNVKKAEAQEEDE